MCVCDVVQVHLATLRWLMTSQGTAKPRCSAVLGRGRPLLCASPLLVSGEGLGYELGGMKV